MPPTMRSRRRSTSKWRPCSPTANLYIQDLADLVAMRQNLAGLEFYPIYVLDLSTVHFVK